MGIMFFSNLLIIDPLAESNGHLLEDDLFWVQALSNRMDRFQLVSSKESVERIACNYLNANVLPHSRLGDLFLRSTNSYHLKYLARMTKNVHGFDNVLLQSFHELSALWFSILNPKANLYLIVTNNLTGAGVNTPRRQALQRILFKRASGIFVGSRFEQDLIATQFPEVPQERVHKMRYHKIGVGRKIVPLSERRREIAFLGAATEERGCDTFINWAALDCNGNYSYKIYGKVNLNSTQRDRIASLYPRIQVIDHYLSDDDYHEVIAKAMFIALPFRKSLEGRLSGVLCDAISHGTPVIASYMEPHIDMFESYGDFGFLVSSDSDKGINEILKSKIEPVWEVFQLAMSKARSDNSLDSIADQVLGVIFGTHSDKQDIGTKNILGI